MGGDRELTEALRKLLPEARPWLVGTVAAVDEARGTCDVTPEDGGEVVKGVSLRMLVAAESPAGLFGVPQQGSPCICAHADGRYKLVYAQKLTKIYAVTAAGFGLAVDGVTDKMYLGKAAGAIHPAVKGDVLLSYLTSLAAWLTAKLGAPAPQPPSFNSTKVFLE